MKLYQKNTPLSQSYFLPVHRKLFYSSDYIKLPFVLEAVSNLAAAFYILSE